MHPHTHTRTHIPTLRHYYLLLLGHRSTGGKPIRARESSSARDGPYDIRERGQRDTRPHSASQQPTPREAAARAAAARSAAAQAAVARSAAAQAAVARHAAAAGQQARVSSSAR